MAARRAPCQVLTIAALALAALALAALAPAAHAGSRTYDVPGTYTFVVPATVTSLDVTSVGGNGGAGIAFPAGPPGVPVPGGRGRVVTSTLAVTPGETLQIIVAGAGVRGSGFAPSGGGLGGGGNAFNGGGGGGGASDVRRAPFGAADRVVVAGGGGGGGSGDAMGGLGGDAGANGANSAGGTPGNGGLAGAGGVGGTGGPAPNACCSGGGNGTPTNGGASGGGNLSGAGGGGGYGGGGGGSGGVTGSGGGGGGGGGSLGTPTGFNSSTSGSGTVTLAHAATTIEVVKSLSPTSDPGRFDLRINGTTFKADAANGDTTQQQVVLPSPTPATVAEAGGTNTDLLDYSSAIACDSGQSGSGPGPLNVIVDAGQSALCTISNTRGTGTLTVVKDLEPSSDPGRFDLQIDGVTRRVAAGDGDGTGAIPVTSGMFTVGEIAVAPTNPALYTTSIECRTSGGTLVASGATTGPLPVHVRSGDDITCTIRNDHIPARLTVTKRLAPASDPGRFDLQIDGVTRRASAADGDSTGAVTVAPGTRTVGELAVAPATAAQYTTAIECRTGNGSGAVVASGSNAGPLDVPVADAEHVACVVTNTRNPNPPPPPPRPGLNLTNVSATPQCIGTGAGAGSTIAVRYRLNDAARMTFTLQRRTRPARTAPRTCPYPLRDGRPGVVTTVFGDLGSSALDALAGENFATVNDTGATSATARLAARPKPFVRTVSVRAGKQRFKLRGAFGNAKLAPGWYRVLLRGVRADGSASQIVAVKFAVLEQSRRR